MQLLYAMIHSKIGPRIQNPRSTLLLCVPGLVYLISYIYLALYHQQINLLHTVIHESGVLTLWETTLYASHFIGHVPVHITAALLLIGSYVCFTDREKRGGEQLKPVRVGAWLLLFLLGTMLFSLLHFGKDDTFAYIMQRRQGVDHDVPGGSWNLHLGSTLMLFLLVPVYVAILREWIGKPVVWNSDGIKFMVGAACFLALFTWIVNGSLTQPIILAWSDPRYLAHSVRELATFPLTYFPLPLFILFASEQMQNEVQANSQRKRVWVLLSVVSVLFVLGFTYQALVPLRIGIGDLAQNPAFTKGDSLGIPYLLAAHYFEHFLDTVFFTLLTLVLVAVHQRKTIPA